MKTEALAAARLATAKRGFAVRNVPDAALARLVCDRGFRLPMLCRNTAASAHGAAARPGMLRAFVAPRTRSLRTLLSAASSSAASSLPQPDAAAGAAAAAPALAGRPAPLSAARGLRATSGAKARIATPLVAAVRSAVIGPASMIAIGTVV